MLRQYAPQLRAAAALLALGLLGFALLPLFLPFLLGYALALGAERGVAALCRRSRLPRWAASGICVTLLLAAVGAVLWFFLRVLCKELSLLVRELPELIARLEEPMERLRAGLAQLAGRAGEGLSGSLIAWIDELFAGGDLLVRTLSGRLTALVSGAVTGLPELLVGLVTTLIAAYMTSAALPELKTWLRTRLPEGPAGKLRLLRERFRAALGGYLKAQLKLLGLIFAILSLGLWILGVEFPLLFGGLIALLDALPVLGTGTVLIPWALVAFLQGSSARGLGLLALYAVSALSRTALEPRLVGRQLGLHPLVTLAAFYSGFRLFGVPGMILLPILTILGKQFLGSSAGAVP